MIYVEETGVAAPSWRTVAECDADHRDGRSWPVSGDHTARAAAAIELQPTVLCRICGDSMGPWDSTGRCERCIGDAVTAAALREYRED